MFKMLQRPDSEIDFAGRSCRPVATLVSDEGTEYEVRMQLIVSDHCYVAVVKYPPALGAHRGEGYLPMSWLNKDIVKAIRKLSAVPDDALAKLDG
jgi:hypothetical protein